MNSKLNPDIKNILRTLEINETNAGASTGISWFEGKDLDIRSISPVDGNEIASVQLCDESNYNKIIQTAKETFIKWRDKQPQVDDVLTIGMRI